MARRELRVGRHLVNKPNKIKGVRGVYCFPMGFEHNANVIYTVNTVTVYAERGEFAQGYCFSSGGHDAFAQTPRVPD